MSELPRCPVCTNELPPGSPQGLCPRCLLQVAFEPSQPGGAEPPTAAYGPGFAAPSVREVAIAFPHLEVLELLGKGGMGAVYKARQPQLDRLVALKILPPETARDPAFAERFLREARALARLNHPHIVTVYDFGQSGGLFYLLMEYVDGVNLRQAMRAGRLAPEEALRIVPHLCDALQFAHDEGVVHRDVKPENILLDRRGRVKVADFGLAKLLGQSADEARLTGTQQAMGTLHYMAPEQLAGARAVDHRADIYSLGVTFYEMLTGALPVGRFPPPSRKAAIDARLDDVVLRTLEHEPADRYQHVSDVKTDIESIALAPDTLPRSPPDAAAPPRGWAVGMAPRPGYARWVGIPTLALLGLYVLATCGMLVCVLGGVPRMFGWQGGADPQAVLALLVCGGSIPLGVAFLALNLAWRFWGRPPPTPHAVRDDNRTSEERTWPAWWHSWSPGARKAAKAALTVALIGFGVLFLSASETETAAEKAQIRTFQIGAFDPWYVSETGPAGFRRSFNLLSLSAGCAMLAALCLQGLALIGRWEKRPPVEWSSEEVRGRAANAGNGLIVCGIAIILAWVPVMLLYGYPEHEGVLGRDGAQAGLPVLQIHILWSLIAGAVAIRGGMELRQMRGYAWAKAGAVVALVPLSTAFVIGLPIGILVLSRLRRRDVQAEFQRIEWLARNRPFESSLSGPERMRDYRETGARTLGRIVGRLLRFPSARVVSWTALWFALYLVFWTPEYGIIDRSYWPYDGTAESTISLQPPARGLGEAPPYRRLLVTERIGIRRLGEARGELPWRGDGDATQHTRHEFVVVMDLNGGGTRQLFIDALDGMSWHHRDHNNSNPIRGAALDVPTALAWMHDDTMKVKVNDAPPAELEPQARFWVDLVRRAAQSDSTPTFFVGRNTVGRMDRLAWHLRNQWINERRPFPFRDRDWVGTEKVTFAPAVSLLWVGIAVMLAGWLVGVWLCLRRRPK